MSTYDGASAVSIQSDGKIVAAGTSYDGDGNQCCFALARYDVDGSLDATFGVGGTVFTGSYGYSGGASSVVIQPDGKIVAAGFSNEINWPNGGFAVYRYNPNGSLDASFDVDGRVITPIGSSYSGAASIALQPDGKIVATGFSEPAGSNVSFALVRYNGDGSLDGSFGTGGIVTLTSQQGAAHSAVLQPDGKIIVACSGSIIRYNSNGSLDTTFGTGGIVTTQSGFAAGTVALQPDGKVVASGSSTGVGNSGDFAVVRYNANGSLDPTFGGGDGITTADFDNSTDNAYGMALDNAGRTVVVGVSDGSFALARFLLDSPATSVTVSGRVTTASGLGLRNATVSITGPLGFSRTATTSTFGFYSFENIPTGGPYTIGVASRRYRFAPRIVTADGNLTSIDFVGLE